MIKMKRLHIYEEVQIQNMEDLGNFQCKGEREKGRWLGSSLLHWVSDWRSICRDKRQREEWFGDTVGRISLAPKDIHGLIPRNCDYVTLYGKSDFADTIKLRILR